jgi:hypothetical protein
MDRPAKTDSTTKPKSKQHKKQQITANHSKSQQSQNSLARVHTHIFIVHSLRDCGVLEVLDKNQQIFLPEEKRTSKPLIGVT